MKVNSIGPFQSSTSLELPDLELETDIIRENSKATSAVDPDAESGDATAEKENRGFVHIMDVIKKEELKKSKRKSRSRAHLYAEDGKNQRAIQAYNSLNESDENLLSKGAQIDKAA